MALYKQIKVKLLDFVDEKGTPINAQLKMAMLKFVRTEANPSGYFIPGKYYDVIDMAGSFSSSYQVLLINEYGEFAWVNIEYVRAYIEPEVLPDLTGVVIEEEKGPADESEEPIQAANRPGRPRKTTQQ